MPANCWHCEAETSVFPRGRGERYHLEAIFNPFIPCLLHYSPVPSILQHRFIAATHTHTTKCTHTSVPHITSNRCICPFLASSIRHRKCIPISSVTNLMCLSSSLCNPSSSESVIKKRTPLKNIAYSASLIRFMLWLMTQACNMIKFFVLHSGVFTG